MPADSYAVAFPVGEISRPRRAEQGSGNQNPIRMRGSLAAQSNRIDDTSLIREAQQGNRAAFEVLVASLRSIGSAAGAAPDRIGIRCPGRVSGAFLKAYKNSAVSGLSALYTWIYRIVTNLCLVICGKRKCAQKRRAGRGGRLKAKSTAAWSSSRMCARERIRNAI